MNRVSSWHVWRTSFVLILLWGSVAARIGAQSATPAKPGAIAGKVRDDPQKLFAAGEAELHAGKLDDAERDFRQVLAIDPGVAGAYANLGVIHMRRKQWPQALTDLHKAEIDIRKGPILSPPTI